MIKLENLYKKFGETEIYKGVNYEFKTNKLTCFFGPSGSGKSTLLNLIAGFDTGYEGDIVVNNINLNKLSLDELCKYRFNNIGFIFQNYNLLKGYTALENVLMGVHLSNEWSENTKKEKAEELLKSLGLEPQINQPIETLSGGQKQRVSIARALINEPKIILADEPTGALDGESTKEIMGILKEISKTRTVVIITHDEEVANYADEIIELDNYNIMVKESYCNCDEVAVAEEVEKTAIYNEPKLLSKISRKLSYKNFKIHLFKYIIAVVIIALGSAAFVGSLSTKKITNNLIEDFKAKNFFYNIGQIPVYDQGKKVNDDIEGAFNYLKQRTDVENIYYQYDLNNITLKNGEKELEIPVKIPTTIANESMAYGDMPREGKNEIALPSNVANKLSDDIKSLIGKEIKVQYINKKGDIEEITLKVSGLTNSQYQDFIVSSNVEKQLYENTDIDEEKPSAVSFTVKDFNEISSVDKELKEKAIGVYTKSQEVDSFIYSFTKLLKLYSVLSYLILIVGLVVSGVMLYKVSVERYSEIGLLGALGYTKKNIKSILNVENIYFAITSTLISCILILVMNLLYKVQFGYDLSLDCMQFIILVVINLGLTIGLSSIINIKLIKTEPAEALRK